MSVRRTVAITLAAGAVLSATALPAAADHVHVRLVGNDRCVILAADGGERYVELPHAEEHAPNRRHPLHVNVHLGQAGTRQGQEVVWVRGSPGDLANCVGGYVNP